MFFTLSMLAAFAWLTCETRGFTVRLATGKIAPREMPSAPALPEQGLRQTQRRSTQLRDTGLLTGGLLLIFLLLSPGILQYLIFQMPSSSESFDCDDGTLLMIERLSRLGIKAKPFLGNLDAEGEAYMETNHIWVLADIFGLWVALDWGTPYLDGQHYEGYTVTFVQLLEFVEQDRSKTPSINVIAASP